MDRINNVNRAKSRERQRESRSSGSRLPNKNFRSLHLEILEDRKLLAVAIPSNVEPKSTDQLLFGIDQTQFELSSEDSEHFFKFAVDNSSQETTILFDMRSSTASDAAFALYDADGNLLKKADEDSDPNAPEIEQLHAKVDSNREYILGILSDSAKPAEFHIVSTVGEQHTNSPIVIDAVTGVASFDAVGSDDVFQSSTDVDYYPLVLRNAGTEGTVSINPIGLDVSLFASIYRRDDKLKPWELMDKGFAHISGEPFQSDLIPVEDQNLTDSEFLLGVAPLGFNTAGGAYNITVSADTIGPATALPPPSTDIGVPPLTTPGQILWKAKEGISPEASSLHAFRAPQDGVASIQIETENVAAVISVFDETGTNLLHVSSRREPADEDHPIAFDLPVQAGAGYLIRSGVLRGEEGNIRLTAKLDYSPIDIEFSQSVSDLGDVSLTPFNNAQFFHLETTPGTDVLVIDVEPSQGAVDPIAPVITIVGNGWEAVTKSIPAGQHSSWTLDVSNAVGPFELMVSGSSGTDPVSVQIGQISVPTEFDLDALEGDAINLQGELNKSQNSSGFGQLAGVAYYNLVTEDLDRTTTITATGSESRPLLGVYEEYGGRFNLLEWVVPDDFGTSTLQRELMIDRHHGVAVLPLGFDVGSSIDLDIQGPNQTGVGVGMTPDPPPKFPIRYDENDEEYKPELEPLADEIGPWTSQLNIRKVVLENEYEQHLWRTILPLNMLDVLPDQGMPPNAIDVRLIPDGYFGGTLEVMRADGSPLTSVTSINGQTSNTTIPVSAVSPGETLLFHVESLPDQLDDGVYTLELEVQTENPHPYEVIERFWRFSGESLYSVDDPQTEFRTFNPNTDPNPATIPSLVQLVGQPVDIVQDQFGEGSVASEFVTTGNPANLNHIDVFRFKAPDAGRLRVWTTIHQEDKINTNLRVYRREVITSANGPNVLFDGLVPLVNGQPSNNPNDLTEVLPNFDWFPANRSQIDAQTYLYDHSDFGTLSDDWYYVVVKNQENSEGRYRIHVDAPTTGLDATVLQVPPASDGQAIIQFTLSSLDMDPETVRYVPIQLPDYHNGQFSLQSNQGHGFWEFAAFDSQGNSISANVQDQVNFTNGDFSGIESGPQTVFLRIKERSVVAGRASATFKIFANVVPPTNQFISPPSTQQPSSPPTRLEVNQFGDGALSATLPHLGASENFYLRAAARPLKVTVRPTGANPQALRWGVYVDGQLAAWDITQFGQDGPAEADDGLIDDSLWTKIFTHLPEYDMTHEKGIVSDEAAEHRDLETIADRDYAYDLAPYHDIVVHVFAMSPLGASFNVEVESEAEKPLRDKELRINPLNPLQSTLTKAGKIATQGLGSAQLQTNISGQEWVRFAIPDGATNVQLHVSRPPFEAGVPISYSVYSSDGQNLIAGGSSFVPALIPNIANISLPNGLGGDAYYVQVSVEGQPTEKLGFNATATFPVNGYAETMGVPVPFPDRIHLDPAGNGSVDIQGESTIPFWVGAPGEVRIEANLGSPGLFDILLYRFYVGQSELLSRHLVLLDYANKSAVNASLHELTANLDPGAYAVELVRSGPQPITLSVNIDTPTPIVEEIVFDPNFGLSNLPGLVVHDRAKGSGIQSEASNLVESYRSALFRVAAPAGTIGSATTGAEATGLGIQPSNEDLEAFVGWWREDGNGSFSSTFSAKVLNPIFPNGVLTNHTAESGPLTGVFPGEELHVVLDRQGLANRVNVHVSIPVPFSGTPDLIVQPILLSPNNGETRVGITVTNVGYAPAFSNTSYYQIRDTSQPANLQWTTAILQTSTLGPFGSSVRVEAWDPVKREDQVRFIVDVEIDTTDDIIGEIEELDEQNNEQIETLINYDEHEPQVVSFELINPSWDGTGPNVDPNDEIWGRYISGVAASTRFEVVVDDQDGNSDLYKTYVKYPKGGTRPFTSATTHQGDVRFGLLDETSGSNPNKFEAYARDIWGLESSREIRQVLVVAKPGWLTNPPGKIISRIEFDGPNGYHITFDNELIDYDRNLNQILGFGVPFIGKKRNQFLVGIHLETTAPLDPTKSISAPVEAHALLKVLGNTVFDVTYDGSTPATEQVGLQTNVTIDSHTLEATALFVGLKLVDLPLLDYQSPKIKLFSFGIPGLASLNANLFVNFLATLNAGVTVALDAAALSDPTQLNPLGFSRPTFVGVGLNPSLTVEGEAELFGFLDIASISGSVGLNIDISVGLENDGSPLNEIVPFDDFFDELGIEIEGSVSIGTSADILGIEVWDYNWQSPPLFSIGDDVVTWDEVNPQNNPIPADAVDIPIVTTNNDPVSPPPAVPLPATGNTPFGSVKTKAAPNLVLADDGGGLFVQTRETVNGVGNLYFSQRSGGVWGALSHLNQPEHILNPTLALTNDNAGMPAVVVYQATAVPNPATIDQFLTSQELRWRYFDGAKWAPEQSLESNGLFDANPSVSFNSSGQGALAWAQNTSPTPLRDPSGNAIMVSLWDPVNHQWTAAQTIVMDPTASDSQPAVHMTEDGTPIVVWLHNPLNDPNSESAAGSEVWFSQLVNDSWSPATSLPTHGISPNGRISQVAIGSAGSDGNGRERIDVLLAHTLIQDGDGDPTTTDDGTAESRLLHRTSWADTLGAAAAAQTVSRNANFSYLNTLPHPDGGMLAYWQQSDGSLNELFASHLAPPGIGGSKWSAPIQLTRGESLEVSPTLAIDVSSKEADTPVFQIVFDQKAPIGSALVLPEPGPNSSDGIPLEDNLNAGRLPMLPELTFERPLTFPGRDRAATGTQVDGLATIANRGLASADVLVEFTRLNDNATLYSQKLNLGPGRTYDLDVPLPVLTGRQDIQAQIKLLNHGGNEMIGPKDNVSVATIFGAPDLVAESIQIMNGNASAGQTVPVEITVRNVSSEDVAGPIVVAFYLGNPSAPLGSGVRLTHHVLNKLSGHEAQTVAFSWTIPIDAGNHVLTGVVDSDHTIFESSEFNNSAWTNSGFLTDLVVDSTDAQLLDYSGVDNVQVTALVENLGRATAKNVEAQLWWTREEEPPVLVATQNIPVAHPSVDPIPLKFRAPGWAGMNSYRVALDPKHELVEQIRFNNTDRDHLFMQGLPDLVPGKATPSANNIQQGDPLDVSFVLKNEGIDDAENIRIEVFAISPIFGRRIVGRIKVEHMTPLSEAQVAVPIDTTELEGQITLWVRIDRLEKILELSDLNNSTFTQIFVATGSNAAPAIVAPETIIAITDEPTVLSGIHITDADAGEEEIELKLRAEFGGLTVRTDVPDGIEARQVAGNRTIDVLIKAKLSAITATFQAGGLSYKSGPGFFGDDTLRIFVSDLGNSGPGGEQTAELIIHIKVVPDEPQDVDSLSQIIQKETYDAAYDFDADNDVDDDDLTHFVTQVLGTNFGDANLDRTFNSTDLIVVFQSGQYEDEIEDNSTWADGDWNADGDFDTGDLVRAFQSGAYSQAAMRKEVTAPSLKVRRNASYSEFFAAADPDVIHSIQEFKVEANTKDPRRDHRKPIINKVAVVHLVEQIFAKPEPCYHDPVEVQSLVGFPVDQEAEIDAPAPVIQLPTPQAADGVRMKASLDNRHRQNG